MTKRGKFNQKRRSAKDGNIRNEIEGVEFIKNENPTTILEVLSLVKPKIVGIEYQRVPSYDGVLSQIGKRVEIDAERTKRGIDKN